MKIAHIVWGLSTGGVETMLVDIVNQQIKVHPVMIIVVNDLIDKSLITKLDSNCKTILLRRHIGSKNPMPWLKLNIALWKYNPDIIHCHLEGLAKMIFHNAPKVCTIHNTNTSTKEYHIFKRMFSISDAVREHTLQQGFDSLTIHNGIHPEQIAQKKNPYRNTPCRIICVGRLFTPHKGQDILVEAARILVDKYKQRDFHVDFIGDGESRRSLEEMIDCYKLSDRVSLLGMRDRNYVYSHLKDYDLFVMPSRSEGFGLTVAESMCAKLPVLVSNLPGPMEVINGGEFGMYFKPEDATELADKIREFISNGANSELVNEAYKYAMTHFDIKHTAESYIQQYYAIK